MGFYGNITNTSNTTFQFDRIYPNRMAMNANANNDGIFIGRYVLVEYDQDAAYPIIYTDGDKFYSSPNKEKTTQIKFETSDGFFTEEIGQVQDIETDNNGNLIKVNSIKFYQCIGGDSDGYAIFELFTSVNSNNKYIQNFAIDEKEFGNSTFKGYDSTVWTKTTETSNGQLITKYVNIADLNSVVPTFDIAADAPTMTPITPHFDADSTNVYYKLHMQSPYGFRIKEGVQDKSDEATTWYETIYDKDTNTTTTTATQKPYADIYYNEAGFNPDVVSKVNGDNFIKLEPTGKSNAQYSHGNDNNDIQEFSLHLPAIGNMMSDAWDIIHGPNRDDSTVDSLQGRLDFFRNEIAHNEIPVQSSETEGYLVGSVINGDVSYENSAIYDDNILNVKTNQSHSYDDPWIATSVNTDEGKDGDKDYHRKAIAIHHTFHPRINSAINELNINDYDGIDGGSVADEDTRFQKIINQDTIQLYVPKVDKAGHVVGTDIDKIVLPYGYKHFTTNGLVDETQSDLDSSTGRKTTASNTQDTLAIDTKNKWLQVEVTDDKIEFAHEIHDIEQSDKSITDLNDGTDTITIQDTVYDNAGHIIANQNHTYTLPYGFKTITVANDGDTITAAPGDTTGTQTADSTQDTLKLTTSNKWVLLDGNTEDTIKFGHLLSPLSKGEHASTDTTLGGFGESFKILKYETDEAGHVVGSGEDTVTLPIGSYTPANSATPHTDIITSIGFTPSSGEITSTKATTNTLQLSSEYSADNGDLKIISGDSINNSFSKIQNYINGLDEEDTTQNVKQYVSAVTQKDGKISIYRAGTETLQINGYNSDNTDSKKIYDGNTINGAFKKLEDRIIAEENARSAAFNTLYGNEEGVKIAETFDTIKEIADFLEQDSSNGRTGVEIIIDDIDTLKNAIDTIPGSVANSIKVAIEGLDSSKSADENKYISGITITDGKISTIDQTTLPIRTVTSGTANGTILVNGSVINVGGLKSAAYTESSAYATAAQGELADNLANIIASYGDIVTYKAEDFVLKSEYDALLSDFNELKDLVDSLNNQINPPETPATE